MTEERSTPQNCPNPSAHPTSRFARSTLRAGYLTVAAVAVALCFGSGQTAAQNGVIFEDTFEDLSQWTTPSNNPDPAGSEERIIESTETNSESFFGEAGDPYLRIYKDHGESATNAIDTADAFPEPAETITISFDFWDRSDVAPGSIDLMVSSTAGVASNRFFHRVKFDKGVLSGATGTYSPDERSRIQIVMNNSHDAVDYLDGDEAVASDSMDIWINGILALSDHTYGRGTEEALPVGTPLGSMRFILSTISRAELLVDNLVVQAGAQVTDVAQPPAFPEPLVEFTFEENSLINTGLLGGEGAYDQTSRMATFGPGLLDGIAMDNSAAGGMGQSSWGDGEDGALKYDPGSGLNNLQSITVTGWFKADSLFNNRAMILAKPNSIQIEGRDNLFQFNALTRVEGVRTSRILRSSSQWHQETGEWTFFAVTANVTEEAAAGGDDNAFMYYAYEDSDDLTLDASGSFIAGAIDNVSLPLAIANYVNDHPFHGSIDNLRIWGSTVDGSAALPVEQLQAVWASDLGQLGTTFAQWAGANFLEEDLADESISGPSAAPAGDGIPNIVKYAFALDPYESGRDGLPELQTVDDTWQLSYPRRLDATDISYVVETSEDLVSWTADNSENTSVTVEPVDEGFERVEVQGATSLNNRLFLRVRIDRN